QAPGFSPQIERWRAHYAAVERELRAGQPAELSPERCAARERALEALALYRERGEFTQQGFAPGGLVPQFVDRAGRRCAVAELLHASGRDDWVDRVHREHNQAWIADLARDADFSAWLERNGLTLFEAARIQTPAGDYRGPADTAPPSGVPADPERPE